MHSKLLWPFDKILSASLMLCCAFFALCGSPLLAEEVSFSNNKWRCQLGEQNIIEKFTAKGFKAVSFKKALQDVKATIAGLEKSRGIVKKKVKFAQGSNKTQLQNKLGKINEKLTLQKALRNFIRNCRDKLLVPGDISNNPAEPSPTPSPSPTPTPTNTPIATLAPPIGLAGIGGHSRVSLAWAAAGNAISYNLYWDTSPNLTKSSSNKIANVDIPYQHKNLSNGQSYYYALSAVYSNGESELGNEISVVPMYAGSSSYDPIWGTATPSSVISFDYNINFSSSQNGSNLRAAILALQAGQMLEIGSGTYTLPAQNFNLNLSGSATSPIWIVAKAGATPIIYMPTTSKNIIDAGSASSPTAYVVLRGITFTGGSAGLRLHHVSNFWLDQCTIHNTGDAGITTNTQNTSHIYITRNHIYDTHGYGEGMYLGANNGAVKMHSSVIALNHVHHTGTGPGDLQGDGIELKQGSFNNLIAENIVHNNNYPSILVYGTDGAAPNIIERNICFNSGDNVLQVQGDAIIRNNLIMGGINAFYSRNHQGSVQNLRVTHNTFVNTGRAVYLADWAGKPNMIFANNIAYSQNAQAITLNGGSTGVTHAGNAYYGSISGVSGGYILGTGLADFINLSWDATAIDGKPAMSSPLVGSADLNYLDLLDINGVERIAPHEAGAFDR
jgi:parallel beta-helix repeat protein